MPELAGGSIFPANMAVGKFVYPLLGAEGIIPGQAEHEFMVVGIGPEAFQGGSHALEVGSSVAEGFSVERNEGGEVAVEQGVASEIQQGAGDVVVPVEPVSEFPTQDPVVVVIQHYHFPPRDASQEGFHILRGPMLAVVDQEPSHLHPYCLGICGLQGIVEGRSHSCERGRVPARGIHFVEGVKPVEMVRAEQGGLLFYVGLLYFCVESVGGG